MPDVLLALEDRLAATVLARLREMSSFGDGGWEFRICPEAGKLLVEPVPGVLVLSRFLPGLEAVLREVREKFAAARTIFLTGRVDQRARAFMDRARFLGFAPNFVTGELPGDRPYPLPVALLHDYGEMVGQEAREDVGVYPAGRVAVLGKLSPTGVDAVKVDRAKRIDRGISAVLVQPGLPGAADRIRRWRRSGYDGPILVYGGYDLDLIAAGATGSVADASGIDAYVAMFRGRGGAA